MDSDSSTRIWFTLDFELGWGVAESGLWKTRQNMGVYRALHERIDELIDLFSRHEISVTWATVGAMITDPGKWQFEHLPLAAKEYLSTFTDYAAKESVDGRSLIEKVEKASNNHTIACHSYSHVRFNYPEYTEAAVKNDLELACAALGSYGMYSNSLVLPQNIEANMGALKRSGISLCRTSPLDRKKNRYLRKFANTVGRFPGSDNWDQDGVLYNSGTLFFNTPAGRWRDDYLLWLLKRATRDAISQSHDLHFWAHPFNFTLNPSLFEVAERYFRWLETLRTQGAITSMCWSDTALNPVVRSDNH